MYSKVNPQNSLDKSDAINSNPQNLEEVDKNNPTSSNTQNILEEVDKINSNPRNILEEIDKTNPMELLTPNEIVDNFQIYDSTM